MAKKKDLSGHASRLRFGTKTHEQLRKGSELLHSRATEVLALADAMQREGIDDVFMDGVQKLDKSIEFIDDFIVNLEKAISDAKREKRRAELS